MVSTDMLRHRERLVNFHWSKKSCIRYISTWKVALSALSRTMQTSIRLDDHWCLYFPRNWLRGTK